MDTEQPQRRRVRAAHARLTRVQAQRERFATRYGVARDAQQRFTAAATSLREVATAKHQADAAEVARRLDQLTEQMRQLVTELHEAQQHQAEKTIRNDARRIARNERRRHDVNESHSGVGRAGTGAA